MSQNCTGNYKVLYKVSSCWNFFKIKKHVRVLSHEDRYKYLITSRSVLRRIRNVSDESCRENQNTHFVCSTFFPPEICAVGNNVGKYSRAGQATDGDMAHARCVTGDVRLQIQSDYVIPIAFPLLPRLHERVSCYVLLKLPGLY
jgi:hypothetical protein